MSRVGQISSSGRPCRISIEPLSFLNILGIISPKLSGLAPSVVVTSHVNLAEVGLLGEICSWAVVRCITKMGGVNASVPSGPGDFLARINCSLVNNSLSTYLTITMKLISYYLLVIQDLLSQPHE